MTDKSNISKHSYQGRFTLDIKNFFTENMVRHGHRLPWGAGVPIPGGVSETCGYGTEDTSRRWDLASQADG